MKKDLIDCQLIALDFSTEMIKRAKKTRKKFKDFDINILKENVFTNLIPDNCADYVISGFGLKTFDKEQLVQLAAEIGRILKKGGEFSLVDVSVPGHKFLRNTYLFYLKNIIPLLGKLFLGNPETYKMLGIYTQEFENSQKVAEIF